MKIITRMLLIVCLGFILNAIIRVVGYKLGMWQSASGLDFVLPALPPIVFALAMAVAFGQFKSQRRR